MLPERLTVVHWDWLVYLEMFLAGIAAGAYVTAAILAVRGRGDSPLARAAHLLAFPVMATAGLLLIVDLARPERFFHMLWQTKSGLPMLKWWSPMSVGSWAVLLFNGFAFVSFLDALVANGWLRLGGWRPGRTLHGSALGTLWAIGGGVVAFFIAAYSGVLLSTTNIPGWGDSVLIGPLYLATAAATGLAALVLVQALRGARGAETEELVRATTWVLLWWLVLIVAFVATAGAGAPVFLSGRALLPLAAAALLGIAVPLILRFAVPAERREALTLSAVLILAGGLLLRFAIVMGPQHG
jgi:formate-dependent nitrite reductase membrane component NrfD